MAPPPITICGPTPKNSTRPAPDVMFAEHPHKPAMPDGPGPQEPDTPTVQLVVAPNGSLAVVGHPQLPGGDLVIRRVPHIPAEGGFLSLQAAPHAAAPAGAFVELTDPAPPPPPGAATPAPRPAGESAAAAAGPAPPRPEPELLAPGVFLQPPNVQNVSAPERSDTDDYVTCDVDVAAGAPTRVTAGVPGEYLGGAAVAVAQGALPSAAAPPPPERTRVPAPVPPCVETPQPRTPPRPARASKAPFVLITPGTPGAGAPLHAQTLSTPPPPPPRAAPPDRTGVDVMVQPSALEDPAAEALGVGMHASPRDSPGISHQDILPHDSPMLADPAHRRPVAGFYRMPGADTDDPLKPRPAPAQHDPPPKRPSPMQMASQPLRQPMAPRSPGFSPPASVVSSSSSADSPPVQTVAGGRRPNSAGSSGSGSSSTTGTAISLRGLSFIVPNALAVTSPDIPAPSPAVISEAEPAMPLMPWSTAGVARAAERAMPVVPPSTAGVAPSASGAASATRTSEPPPQAGDLGPAPHISDPPQLHCSSHRSADRSLFANAGAQPRKRKLRSTPGASSPSSSKASLSASQGPMRTPSSASTPSPSSAGSRTASDRTLEGDAGPARVASDGPQARPQRPALTVVIPR